MSGRPSGALCDDSPAEAPPVDRVEGDTDRECGRLDERAGGVGDAECEYELVELRQEQRGDSGGDEVAATAQQRRAAEHDRGDRRQEVVVALVGSGLVDDAGVHDGGEAVEDLRPDVGGRLVAFDAEARGAGGDLVGTDALEASPRRGQLDHRCDDSRDTDGEVHRSRDPQPEPAAHPRQAGGGRRRDPRRVPEHGPEEQSVRPECGDDRVETHPADQEPVQETGTDGCEERDADRGQSRALSPPGTWSRSRRRATSRPPPRGRSRPA